MNLTVLLHFLLGPLILLFALLYKIFQPKDINGRIGYRTARSMQSREAWQAANEFAANGLLIAALMTLLVQVIAGLSLDDLTGIIVSVVFETVALVSLIPMTESHLKKNFDGEGNRIGLRAGN